MPLTFIAYCCFLCSAVFKFSFKLNERFLLLVLYAWHLRQIYYVLFALWLLCFIFQNWLDSSVSDLQFLRWSDFCDWRIVVLMLFNKYRSKCWFLISHLVGVMFAWYKKLILGNLWSWGHFGKLIQSQVLLPIVGDGYSVC